MANGYDEYDPYGYNEYPAEWGAGGGMDLPPMGGETSFGEELSAGAVSGVAGIGLPAMGFGLVALNEWREMGSNRVADKVGGWARGARGGRGIPGLRNLRGQGMGDMMGIRPGWRAGRSIGRLGSAARGVQGAGATAKIARGFGTAIKIGGKIPGMAALGVGAGVAGAAIGFGVAMAPMMAIEAGVGYIAENMMEGAESYSVTNRMMESMGEMATGATFGSQSILEGGSGWGSGAIRDWTMAGGHRDVTAASKMSGLGRQGITDLGGAMMSSGMLGNVGGPDEFMTKFRNKLQQVQKLSQTLDVSINEATQVMAEMTKAGVSGDEQGRLGAYAGTVSSLTGRSFGTVMQHGLQGAQMATQVGLTADQGMGLSMANLSSVSTLGGLGALDQGLLNRVGGEQALAQRLTSISLNMSRSYRGQQLMSRLANEEGTGFDFERLSSVTGGGRGGSRRRLDPYAMDDLAQEFRENEGQIVLGQIQRLRARHGEGRDFNRQQYQLLAGLGISDPQEQLAYLQNLRTAPVMQVMESQQQRRDQWSQTQGQAGYSNDSWISQAWDTTLSTLTGQGSEDWSRILDEHIGEPVRKFGRQFAQAMEEAGDQISRFVHGRQSTDVGPLRLGAEAISDYSRDIWRGNVHRSMSSQDVVERREQVGWGAERDFRGWWGRNSPFGGEPDTRLAARGIEAISTGQISERMMRDMGITMYGEAALDEEALSRYESEGRLINREAVDLPGYQGASDTGYLVASSQRGRMAFERELLQQGRGARRGTVRRFGRLLEGSLGGDVMTRIQEATEEGGAAGYYQAVGEELGLGGDMSTYSTSDRRTIERIAQEFMPTEVREGANITAAGVTTESYNAQQAAGIAQDLVYDIAGIDRRRAEDRRGQQQWLTGGMGIQTAGGGVYMGNAMYSGVVQNNEARERRFNEAETIRFEQQIQGAIETQAGRDYLQWVAAEAEVAQEFGVDVSGFGRNAGRGEGQGELSARYDRRQRLMTGRGLTQGQIEEMVNQPWVSEEFRDEFLADVEVRREEIMVMDRDTQLMTGTGQYQNVRRVSNTMAYRYAALEDAAIRQSGDFMVINSDEEASDRLDRLVMEGRPDSDQATRLLLAGFNPTSETDRERVRGQVGEAAYTAWLDLGADFEQNTAMGQIVGEHRRTLMTTGGISPELDRAITSQMGSRGTLLADIVQEAESTAVSAARSELLINESEDFRRRVEDRLVSAYGTERDREGDMPVLGTEAQRFLEVMGGADISVGEGNMADVNTIVNEEVASTRARRLREERARLEESGEFTEEAWVATQQGIDREMESLRETRTEQMTQTDYDLTLEQAMYVSGQRMGQGGLDAGEQIVISELGAGGEALIQLSEALYGENRANQEQLENMLTSMPFGEEALNAMLEDFATEGDTREEQIANLAEQMREDPGAREQIFSSLVGRAVGSGFMSTDMIQDKATEERERQNNEYLEAMAGNFDVFSRTYNETVDGNRLVDVRVRVDDS